jgi:hypothetical protein
VQVQTAARNVNPRTGKGGGNIGGGRVNPNNLFGTLLHNVSMTSRPGEPNTMYYRVEKSNGKRVNGEEKSKRPPYYTTIGVSKRFDNRVQFLEFQEAFFPFLEHVDYKAILRDGEPEDVAKTRDELEIAEAAQGFAKTLVEKREKVVDNPESDQILAQQKLSEALKNLKSADAQVEKLQAKYNVDKAKADQFLHVKELVRLIKQDSLDPLEKLQVHAEITRRIKSVNLDFRIDPKVGKMITADVVFTNGVTRTRTITIYSDQHYALLFEGGKGKERPIKVQLTPEVHPKRKMTDEMAIEIHRLDREEKMSTPEISRLTGLSQSTVRRTICGARNTRVFRKLFPDETPMLEKSKSKYANGALLTDV